MEVDVSLDSALPLEEVRNRRFPGVAVDFCRSLLVVFSQTGATWHNTCVGWELNPPPQVPATSKVFDLEKQKHAALASLPARGRESPAFKQFFKSQLADDYLCAALDHFAALLRVEDMMQTRIAGKKPQDIQPPSPGAFLNTPLPT